MRVGTLVSLGASAVLGIGALFVAKVWLPASNPTGKQAAGRPAAEVPVVVAALPLPYGVKLEPKHLTVTRMPASAAPVGAYATVEQVLAQDGGAPVVLVPLVAREPVLATKVSGPGSRKSIAAVIEPGMRAYTIRVTDVAGVGGHALPGDRVDVLLTRDVSGDHEKQRFVSDVVIQNVRVLGMDLNADPTSIETATRSTSTLEVSVEDAQKLSVAADLGSLSLALRRSGASEPALVRRVLASDLGAGAPGGIMTRMAAVPPPPAPPATPTAPVVRRAAAPAPSNGRRVVVVHGEQAAEVSVRPEWGA